MASTTTKLLRQARIMMPNIPMVLMHRSSKLSPNTLVFRTTPKMTKIEIQRYFQQIYGVKVLKVNTVNVEGAKKRVRRPGQFIKQPDIKKAYVTFEAGVIDEIASSLSFNKAAQR